MATNIDTDIALIKKDIANMNKFFGRVETTIDMMGELTKDVAVRNEILEHTKQKLDDVEKMCDDHRRTDLLALNVMSDRLEEYRRSAREDHQRLADHNADKRIKASKEIIDRIDSMEKALHARMNETTKKINALENWRYYIMGAGAALMLLLAKLNWPGLFS
jgi:chromosome segregation ATPase|tara:strand:+ start:265 stop:750 length:486 start_codon:yes stop_codon:yes gene_type:complete